MPPIDEILKFVPLAQLILVVSSISVAAYAVFQQIIIHKRNKRADTILHCNLRYDAVYDYKLKINSLDDVRLQQINMVAYYARYWGLKADEFDYWLAGLVDIETLCNWAFMTARAFQENSQIL